MALTITFNGKSSDDFLFGNQKWLHVASKPLIPPIQEDVKLIRVPGRDGALSVREGTYAPIEISVTFSFHITPNHYQYYLDSIYTWLLDPDPSDPFLKFSHRYGKYKVIYVRMGELTYESRYIARQTAIFTCEALKYSEGEGSWTYGDYYAMNSSFRVFVTTESYPLKGVIPYFKPLWDFNVTQAGAVSVYNQTRNEYFYITFPTTGHIYVDSDLMITYRLSGTKKINLSSCVDGDYETLWRRELSESWIVTRRSGSNASVTTRLMTRGRFYV